MHACEWCHADVADEYDHLCSNCERNYEAEAAEMRVTEDDRWEYAQWQWEQAHEGEWDNYTPDEPEQQ